MFPRKKRKVITIYILVLIVSFTLIGYLQFSGKIKTEPKLISSWDTDLEGWLMAGGDFATISSDHTVFYEGTGALRIEYDWGDIKGGDWYSLSKDFKTPQDFTPYYGISFWVKGDGSDTRYRVALREQDGEYWMSGNWSEELFLLDSKEWQLVTIPFSQFKHDVFTSVVDGFLDLQNIKVTGIIFSAGTTQKGVVYFDELQLPANPLYAGIYLILMGTVSVSSIFTASFFIPKLQTKLRDLSTKAKKIRIKMFLFVLIIISLALSTLSFTIIGYLLFSGEIQTEPKLISSWDTDSEGWHMTGGEFATISSDHTVFYEGTGALRIEYNWRDTYNGADWFSLSKDFKTSQDFTPYYGISFWVKGDGSDTRYRVALREQDGEYWMSGNWDEEVFLLDSKEWQLVTIPFSQFKHDAFTPVVDGFLDLQKIKVVGLIFWDGTTQTGCVYFDELQLPPNLPYWN